LVSKFRTKASTIDNHITKKLWKDYHKNLVAPFANVNYGYAITCHKGQGSNFFNVFVDVDDIVKNGRENETKKCLYTALTRASNELHMLLS
jgi:ATP-dependent exoDNAse (exonuclease V) alpha subunit